MSRRPNRRSTRPIHDLPSLFDVGEQEMSADSAFRVRVAVTDSGSLGSLDEDDLSVAADYRERPTALRFMSMGSGSSGNCSYVGTATDGILIDAGIDNHRVLDRLAANGISIDSIRGIFLTHDHGDHVKYAYALLRRNPHMRLYSTLRTLEGILRRHNISRRIKDYHSPIFKEHEYRFGDMTVTPFETSHDGTDNCGYAITAGASNLVIATDMGMITERADYYMRRARALVIESNYDADMLARGRYTEHLKARIRSAIGHMDNHDTAAYLVDIYSPSLTHIFLCHLSEDNNTPETAMATAINALRSISIVPAASSADIGRGTVYIKALPRHEATELYLL